MDELAPTPDTDDAQFGTGRVSVDFARRMERERDALRDAIRKASEDFYNIAWSWEGDCGSCSVISNLEDLLPENQ